MDHQAARVDTYIEEDEIDLRELFSTLTKNKLTIITITALITLLAIIYVLLKTPTYEVKSNLMVGYIGLNQEGQKINIADPDTIAKRLNLVFNVEDKIEVDEFISEVSSISINKKLTNFITIKTEAISNEEALKKNKEVITYVQELYQPKIDRYLVNTDNSIRAKKTAIKNLENLEKKNIERQIELLKTQDIVKIDEQIKRLKAQDIVKLQRKIKLLKAQNIAKIDEKINFYQNKKLKTLEKKISFQTKKLKEYTKEINNIYTNTQKNTDSATLAISSIQMVNYQNLILNSQNKIEDLKSEIEVLKYQTIPNLKREKMNISNVNIKDLELQINNIKKITIVNLERQKNNLLEDKLRQLTYTLNISLPRKKMKLEEEIEQLIYNKSKQNIQNSQVIGEYIIKDYPFKPKKKLIVIVAFITGLILSIFLVFFLEFIKGTRKEDEPKRIKN